jgi:hypothetical protein
MPDRDSTHAIVIGGQRFSAGSTFASAAASSGLRRLRHRLYPEMARAGRPLQDRRGLFLQELDVAKLTTLDQEVCRAKGRQIATVGFLRPPVSCTVP